MTLISPSEMAALRGVAESGMASSVDIWRRATTQTDSGQRTDWAYSSTTTGWLYSDPTKTLIVDAGALVDVNTVRLFVPVGTDILSGDKAIVAGSEYLIVDTNVEGTWLPLIRCSLRRSE